MPGATAKRYQTIPDTLAAMERLESYKNLSPDDILNAVETAGYRCDGRIFALNSYENRVYQVGIEDTEPLIAKFYRPDRWTEAAILEEHDFSRLLAEQEIPVIAPVAGRQGNTLFHVRSFRFALYPRAGGRTPELDNPEHLSQLGRTVARLHNFGAIEPFRWRPELNTLSSVMESGRYLLDHEFIPQDLTEAYRTLRDDLLVRL